MGFSIHWVRVSSSTLGLLCGLAVLTTSMVGCGSNSEYPPLGSVTGVVTLDGQPLADADVTFQPDGEGRAAIGTTDSQGRYELVYLNDVKGATLGSNLVLITTFRDGSDDGSTPEVPEKLPARYHSASTVKVDVAKGGNTFDFDLESK